MMQLIRTRLIKKGGRSFFLILLILPVVLLAMYPISLQAAGESPENRTSDIEEWASSVVRLEIYDAKGDRIGTGSGFAMGEPAVLVTACHVIVNMEYMIATRDDGSILRMDHVIDVDEDADVAICELPEDAHLASLPAASADPFRGDPVTAIGSQFGLVNLVTLGNVCGRWEAMGTDWILFTAPVSEGSSGGPLLNENGEVIGVITGTYEKGQNLNLAAPATKASDLAAPD